MLSIKDFEISRYFEQIPDTHFIGFVVNRRGCELDFKCIIAFLDDLD